MVADYNHAVLARLRIALTKWEWVSQQSLAFIGLPASLPSLLLPTFLPT